MKITTGLLLLAMIVTSGTDTDNRISVLEKSEPTLVDNGPVILQDQTVLEKPAIIEEAAPSIDPRISEAQVVPHIHNAPFAAPCDTCIACKCVTCCCKPKRKVETTFCIVDPCDCEHEVCACIPACCLGETPEICWGRRLLGRQVATLCWPCCDHEVKVIITRRGKVKVRD